MKNTIEIYKSPDHKIELKVNLDNETVWLSQEQLVVLFDRDQSVISRHIRNVFKEGELEEECNMQKMHIPNSDKPVTFYNLDVIISVGYRVKSQRGTQFRQWATQRLKEYLVEGVAINEKRLAQKNQEIKILHDGIRILSRAIEAKANLEDHNWLLEFSEGLKLLDDYDHEQLDKAGKHTSRVTYPAREEYMAIVESMRTEFNTAVFGMLKDTGFDSAIGQIQQGFGKKDIYPSIEEKAAMLLYLIVKNHAFVDGNKRIAAACFLLFLDRNNLLFDNHGNAILSNEALASITLLVASSKSDEMETMKQLIISILNRNNP
jgi:prophage maintenance system killer protein